MSDEKKFYIIGDVKDVEQCNHTELLWCADTMDKASQVISNAMNGVFPPKNIFVIEGIKREIKIKQISF